MLTFQNKLSFLENHKKRIEVFSQESDSTFTNVCQLVTKIPKQLESFILHHLTFILHHSTFILQHSSFIINSSSFPISRLLSFSACFLLQSMLRGGVSGLLLHNRARYYKNFIGTLYLSTHILVPFWCIKNRVPKPINQ